MKKVFAIFGFKEVIEVYLENTFGLKKYGGREYLSEEEAEKVVEELIKKSTPGSDRQFVILPVYVRQDWYEHLKTMYYAGT